MTPEGKVKAAVRKVMRSIPGIYTFPINASGFGRHGIPDDYFCAGGVPAFVEYKARLRWDKNHVSALKTLPTPSQIIEMRNAREAGMRTYVIDAENMNEFIDALTSGVAYAHEWTLDMRDYRWYRGASPAFFERVIVPAFAAGAGIGLKPYEVVPALAVEYDYQYNED